MLASHLTLAALWALYGWLHSWLASGAVKAKVRQWLGPAFKHYRLGYTVFAALTLVAIAAYGFALPAVRLFSPSLPVVIAGGLIALAGLWLMAVCIKKYFLRLSGVRSLVEEAPTNELQVSGVHRWVRHPLYLGTFGALWGAFLLWPLSTLFVSNLVITLYTVLAIPFEEAKLVQEFGPSYKAYQQQVPRLWPRRPSSVRIDAS